uniref:Uncharacterized protein n=1 Tax=Rhizophora mucronata TaxID=61149 RepID=A0A2P2NAV0_RHIMU
MGLIFLISIVLFLFLSVEQDMLTFVTIS